MQILERYTIPLQHHATPRNTTNLGIYPGLQIHLSLLPLSLPPLSLPPLSLPPPSFTNNNNNTTSSPPTTATSGARAVSQPVPTYRHHNHHNQYQHQHQRSPSDHMPQYPDLSPLPHDSSSPRLQYSSSSNNNNTKSQASSAPHKRRNFHDAYDDGSHVGSSGAAKRVMAMFSFRRRARGAG